MEPECYYLKDDILMRKWRPPNALSSEEWRQVHQIVVPKIYRQEIIELAQLSVEGALYLSLVSVPLQASLPDKERWFTSRHGEYC
jgi:hypothetical protein